ncbi:hypothetical protein BT69DRAFT_205377 [Atractiella rhizophila]|nr:hypothetical protein BT69DRAFT_205377 [Atractiella rhizophila]
MKRRETVPAINASAEDLENFMRSLTVYQQKSAIAMALLRKGVGSTAKVFIESTEDPVEALRILKEKFDTTQYIDTAHLLKDLLDFSHSISNLALSDWIAKLHDKRRKFNESQSTINISDAFLSLILINGLDESLRRWLSSTGVVQTDLATVVQKLTAEEQARRNRGGTMEEGGVSLLARMDTSKTNVTPKKTQTPSLASRISSPSNRRNARTPINSPPTTPSSTTKSPPSTPLINRMAPNARALKNWGEWPHGTSPKGYFRISMNQCYHCGQEGHWGRECTLQKHQQVDSLVREFKKYGIDLPRANANAYVIKVFEEGNAPAIYAEDINPQTNRPYFEEPNVLSSFDHMGQSSTTPLQQEKGYYVVHNGEEEETTITSDFGAYLAMVNDEDILEQGEPLEPLIQEEETFVDKDEFWKEEEMMEKEQWNPIDVAIRAFLEDVEDEDTILRVTSAWKYPDDFLPYFGLLNLDGVGPLSEDEERLQREFKHKVKDLFEFILQNTTLCRPFAPPQSGRMGQTGQEVGNSLELDDVPSLIGVNKKEGSKGYESAFVVSPIDLSIDVVPAHPPSNPSARNEKFHLDSGASIHLTTCDWLLHNYRVLSTPIGISGAFGSTGYAVGVGDLRPVFQAVDEKIHSGTIRNVFFAPKLGVNLLSSRILMKSGVKFTNDTQTVYLAGRDDRVFGTCEIGNRLITLQSLSVPGTSD